MEINIKVLHDKIVIKKDNLEEKTVSGIILSEGFVEKPYIGIIVAVGDGKVLDNGTKICISVKIGDKVVFGKYAGQQIAVDDKEYLVMSEHDILCILL